MSDFKVGQEVNVIQPYVVAGVEALFLPGELLFIVSTPMVEDSDYYRVRCPATGADEWMSGHLLVAVPENMTWQEALKNAQASGRALGESIMILQSGAEKAATGDADELATLKDANADMQRTLQKISEICATDGVSRAVQNIARLVN
jgi:hypothetical protein